MTRQVGGGPDGEEQVVLVDEEDRETGVCGKLEAHRRGLLHRAVSVFLLDSRGRLLVQRRAAGKYHSQGLWSNACCGHPRPGESPLAAARRRLREELGVEAELLPAGRLLYRAEVPGGLVEHELDHLFVGAFEGRPVPDPAEVQDWRWLDLEAMEASLLEDPEAWTSWLAPAWRAVRGRLGDFGLRG